MTFRKCVLGVATVVLAACTGASPITLGVPQGDDPNDKPIEADRFTLPQAPDRAQLLPFRVSIGAGAEYFVDPRSIEVSGDGVIRATIVARRPQAAEAVTYEGLRCVARERRIYAYGRADNSWVAAKPSEWRRMPAVRTADYASTLYSEFFCPRSTPIRSAREGIDALRRGGHSDASR